MKFDDSPSDGVLDSTGKNNGTCVGTCTRTTGHDGTANTAYQFNGVSSVDVSNEANFDFERNNNFTISAWIKANPKACAAIVAKGISPVQDYRGYILGLNCGSGDKLRFDLVSTSSV